MNNLFRILIIGAFSFQSIFTMAQDNQIPYDKIESYPISYTSGSVVSRMVDGLGYRYHWASKDLRAVDLVFTPGNEGKSTLETLKHVYELSQDALSVSEGKELIRPRVVVEGLTYTELREVTLKNYHQASENFRKLSEKELSNLTVTFASGDNKKAYPFWNFLNGQLSDAIYHTGQIVSFRRSSGNPVSKEMNVFTGGMY